MPKELLKRKLVEKYPGVFKKLTPKGQELLVEKLDTKVTTEDEVEDFVNGLENTIDVFVDVVVSESDRRVREAKPKTKTGTETTEGGEDDGKGKGGSEQDDKYANLFKSLSDKLDGLTQQLAQEKGKSTLSELVAAAKAKGIPERLANKYAIGENYDQATALSELESDWADIKQFTVNKSTGDGRTPSGGGTGDGKDVSAAIKNFAKSNVEASAKTVTK